MKRSYTIVLSGMALVVAGYFGFPVLSRYFLKPSAGKHVDVSTAKLAAIHIATSDPKTTLLVSEEDGVVSVAVTRMDPDGDYIDGSIRVQADSSNLELQLSQRKKGAVTIFKRSDADGLPTRKSVGTQEGIRSYQRQNIEWIEVPPSEKPPIQIPEPTPGGVTHR